MNKKLGIVLMATSLVAAGVVVASVFFVFQVAPAAGVQRGAVPVSVVQVPVSPREQQHQAGPYVADGTFMYLPSELLQRDPNNIKLIPSEGYVITTSIVSHKRDRVVYAEISDCIGLLNDYSYDPRKYKCDLSYRIHVQNLQSGETKELYSYPAKVSLLGQLAHSIVTPASAGGCLLLPFPLAWSKNDQKIVLKLGNPSVCGSGGGPRYATVTLDPSGGSLENLSTYDPIFLDDYSKVVFIDESADFVGAPCYQTTQDNYGKIVLRYVETGETVVLLDKPNAHYSTLTLSPTQKAISYWADSGGCPGEDRSGPEAAGSIQLP